MRVMLSVVELARHTSRTWSGCLPGHPANVGFQALEVLSEERDLIDPVGIFESPDKVPLFGHPGVFLVDDMLTNQDWLRPPLSVWPTG